MDNQKYVNFCNKWQSIFEKGELKDLPDKIGKSFQKDCQALKFEIVELGDILMGDVHSMIKQVFFLYDLKLIGNYLYSLACYIEDSVSVQKANVDIGECLLFQTLMNAFTRIAVSYREFEASSITRIKLESSVFDNQDKRVQRVNFYIDGRVVIDDYTIEDGHKIKTGSRKYKLNSKQANLIFTSFYNCFSKIEKTSSNIDNGSWMLEFYAKRQSLMQYMGGIGKIMLYAGNDLTKIICDTLGVDDLLLFEGGIVDDQIDNLCLILNHSDDELDGFRTYEQLTINNKDQFLEYSIFHDDGTIAMNRIESEGVSMLLANILADVDHFEFEHHDNYQNPKAGKYTLKINRLKFGEEEYSGYYDKMGLASNWPSFIGEIYHFINLYRDGEVFDPSSFTKRRRLKDEYILCSVLVKDEHNTSYYLCDDDEVAIMDTVVVPIGHKEQLQLGQVLRIDYLDERHLPTKKSELKKIERIIDKEELDDFGNLNNFDYQIH